VASEPILTRSHYSG